MGKAKQFDKRKPPKSSPARGKMSKKRPKRASGRKRSEKCSPLTASPLGEAHFTQAAGVPDESQIDEAAGVLGPEERKTFAKARQLLAEHLGSHAAARLWLVSPGTGFETTALDAIRAGQGKLVLATLETQWGPSPTYA